MKNAYRVGENGKKLFELWEGKRSKPYKDSAGLWTIGIGHLITLSESTSGKIYIKGYGVFYQLGLSDQEIYDLLEQDLDCAEVAINAWVHVPLSQNQFDALCSFVFNVGVNAFQHSTLLKMLNNGLYNDIPGQLERWNKIHGIVSEGLKNRREKEIELWLK